MGYEESGRAKKERCDRLTASCDVNIDINDDRIL